MQSTHPAARLDRTPAAIGITFVLVGVAALALRQAGIDVAGVIRDAGWQFFIILPGLALLAASVVPAPPRGIGFAIAGSIVTTVGLILIYQEANNHFESWAYAWALIPAAAGIGTLVYGLITAQGELVVSGLRTAAIAAVLFVAGFWFFESTFETGRAPIDLATWWPLLVIALGVLLTLGALMTRRLPDRAPRGDDVPALEGDLR
jgi:hypothetical protein